MKNTRVAAAFFPTMLVAMSSLCLAPLCLAQAGPSQTAPTSTTNTTPAPMGMAADPADERHSFTQRAKEDMQAWHVKVQDFDARAEASGRKDLSQADRTLKAAWVKTSTESEKLQAASGEDWEKAKISYQKAAEELSDAWDKARKKM